MDEQKPMHEALRLLCLHSLVNNGIKALDLWHFAVALGARSSSWSP